MTWDQVGGFTRFDHPIVVEGFFVWQASVFKVVLLDLRSYLKIAGAK